MFLKLEFMKYVKHILIFYYFEIIFILINNYFKLLIIIVKEFNFVFVCISYILYLYSFIKNKYKKKIKKIIYEKI
jgi:hypothetical protein